MLLKGQAVAGTRGQGLQEGTAKYTVTFSSSLPATLLSTRCGILCCLLRSRFLLFGRGVRERPQLQLQHECSDVIEGICICAPISSSLSSSSSSATPSLSAPRTEGHETCREVSNSILCSIELDRHRAQEGNVDIQIDVAIRD